MFNKITGVIFNEYYRKCCKTTQNGKDVRYIIADLDCVSVVKISGSVLDSGMYGINGTFFNPDDVNKG